MNDWIEGTVLLQPLTRKLEDALAQNNFSEAERLAIEISDITNDVIRYCIGANIRSGEGRV